MGRSKASSVKLPCHLSALEGCSFQQFFWFAGWWKEYLASTTRVMLRLAKTLNCRPGLRTFLNMDSSHSNALVCLKIQTRILLTLTFRFKLLYILVLFYVNVIIVTLWHGGKVVSAVASLACMFSLRQCGFSLSRCSRLSLWVHVSANCPAISWLHFV